MSGEHEVSLSSAQFVAKNLIINHFDIIYLYIDKKGSWHHLNHIPKNPKDAEHNPIAYHFHNNSFINNQNEIINIDFFFPIIHGTYGEDGTLQGFFEIINQPYAGNGVYTSSVCMDKYHFHRIMERSHIPQVPYYKLEIEEWTGEIGSLIEKIPFGFPWFIKPANMGSSVGVHKATDENNLKQKIDNSFLFDSRIIIEYGYDVREIEFSILGNYPNYQISEPAEIIPHHEFYSYEAKYQDENGASLVLPADLDKPLKEAIQDTAIRAFHSISGEGFARIDFFLEKNSGKFYLNEINTIPGFTPISMFPRLWQISGIEPDKLIREIISLGYERWKRKKKLKTDYIG